MNSDNQNDKYFYNIKQINGKTVIEKIDANGTVISSEEKTEPVPYRDYKGASDEGKTTPYQQPSMRNVDRPLSTMGNGNQAYQYYQPKKSSKGGLIAVIVVLIVAIAVVAGLMFAKGVMRNANKKSRTFMIYMVGSDLESSSKMATYDLKDIENANIDLDDMNVVLIVGGSTKWHNFVDANEVAIYELESSGFKKVKSMPAQSMGTTTIFKNFLDYSYDNYPAEKYDLLFWDHGLGAVGLEYDDLNNDYIHIGELDSAFKSSPFKKEKLETVIFLNCLAGNYHFANIMSDYAEYMVGSEEIMYVAMVIDRLNFLEKINPSDNGYDIAKKYIDQSERSTKLVNNNSYRKIETTLSILDLSNMKNLDNALNNFFKSTDLDNNYYSIARARNKIHTYGDDAPDYDTVDLFELIDALSPYVNNKGSIDTLKKELNNTIKYNVSTNNYSKGLSIYFPYYGPTDLIETQFYLFSGLWNNDYTKFVSSFYDLNGSTKRARRAVTGSEINHLTNNIQINGNRVTIQLSEEEKEEFSNANIYVFDQKDGKYELLLKSTNVSLEDNTLTYNHYGILKTNENHPITLIDDKEYKVYESHEGTDLISFLAIENGTARIVGSKLDSGDKPSGALYERDDTLNTSLYKLSYALLNGTEINAEWMDTVERESIEVSNVEELIIDESLSGHYILIEMFDINNDSFYSEVKLVN